MLSSVSILTLQLFLWTFVMRVIYLPPLPQVRKLSLMISSSACLPAKAISRYGVNIESLLWQSWQRLVECQSPPSPRLKTTSEHPALTFWLNSRKRCAVTWKIFFSYNKTLWGYVLQNQVSPGYHVKHFFLRSIDCRDNTTKKIF